MKRGTRVVMAVILMAAFGGLGYGVASATGQLGAPATATATATASTAPSVGASPQSAPEAPPQQILPAAAPLEPVPAVLEPGDHGPQVRALQARLRQLAWYAGDVTDDFTAKTTAAVRGFQAKRGLPTLGYVDRATLARLTKMTHTPSQGELDNRPTDGSWTDAPLDTRCQAGRVLCVDKSSRTLRWVVDGIVQRTVAVRFGSQFTPTREGVFAVNYKSRNHVSSLYDTSMPFAMFFSGGQAVHYSPDFAARGYSGASHGCVNVRDHAAVAWLFDQVRVGDQVVIYWS